MASGQEDTYSYDLTALVDYEPKTYQATAPPTVGVGGRLNTPPPPSTPGFGVGTNTSPAQTNVTVGMGGTQVLRQQTEPIRVARQITPSSPSDAGSRRRSNASGSHSGGSRRGSGGEGG